MCVDTVYANELLIFRLKFELKNRNCELTETVSAMHAGWSGQESRYTL